jgi:hypothetical protein
LQLLEAELDLVIYRHLDGNLLTKIVRMETKKEKIVLIFDFTAGSK